MMNTKLIIASKNQVDNFVVETRTVQEDEILTQQYQSQLQKSDTIQGEDWRIFMPVISPFD